jgi:alanyl-tRNA synthetase
VKGCPEAPESPDCDCRRHLEIWNLVFQQYDRKGANHLVPLTMKNIDTGAGFERILTVLAHLAAPKERIYSNFSTPLFRPLVARVLALAPQGGSGDEVAARRIADHVRAAVLCIADGVRPSNEGRGFVLRRVIRRAARDGIQLGIGRPFLHECVGAVGEMLGRAYPDVVRGEAAIGSALRTEEERFRQTYEEGMARLAGMLEGRRPGSVLSGADAFLLHDTYGFPVDVTGDILRERGFDLDRAGFDAAMEAARKKSREGSKMATDIFAAGPLARVKRESPGTLFLGYGPKAEGPGGSYDWAPGVAAESVVAEILVAEKPADRLEAGQEGALVLRETPFYAEQGGQVGDTGVIRTPDGALFRVKDTVKVEGFHLHVGRLEGAALPRGATVEAVVDQPRRDAIRRNHTATHLLHRALRALLGEEARQAGSLVAPDYLRFDFSFPRGLTAEERETLEAEVNRRVFANAAVETRVLDVEAARATGAVSMFGEKYGARVRVLTAGDSREFCGGTHCRATGDIGSFRILSEKSIGSGVRRIEAVTGERAVREFQEERRRAQTLLEEIEKLKKEAAKAAKKSAAPASPAAPLDPLALPRRKAGKVEFVVLEGEGIEDGALMGAGDRVKADAGGPFAALVASRGPEGVVLVAAGNPAAVKAGFKAGAAVKAAAEKVGGGGGGRPDFARGKGKDAAALPEAVKAFETYLAGL